MFSTLGDGVVYHSERYSFFVVRHKDVGPYAVYFRPATGSNYSVILNVQSAHLRPDLAEFAAPVKFSALVEAVARSRAVPMGPKVQLRKRK